MPKFIINK